MTVLGVNVFGLLVAFLAGVVTGGMVVFFVRGPVVAYFRVKDESPPWPVRVEVLAPQGRPRVSRQRPWDRVATQPTWSALPAATRRQLGRGGAS